MDSRLRGNDIPAETTKQRQFMANDTITCPKCGYAIPVTEALTHSIRERLKGELENGIKKKEAEISAKERQLAQAQRTLEEQMAAKLKAETARIQTEAEKKAAEKIRIELEDLKSQVNEKEKKIAEAREAELELRKKARELEEARQAFELEVARKIDAERERVRLEASAKFAEEHRLKDAEKDKLIKDLQQSLEDAKRRAEQGSMQLQGEVQELDLEATLRSAFPFDDIQPVPKGIRGADVIQRVFDPARKPCGVILWEAKHTKHWSDSWVQKLKDDQREIGADISVILTEVMPRDMDHFGLKEGVWVTRFNLALGLATALRKQLMDVNLARSSAIGKNEKMEMLYQYLSGPEFRQKIEAMGEAFTMMQAQLDKEKRAMQKIWKEREKHIQRIALNTAGMYGDVRGIIGASLPEIEVFELGPAEPRQLESGSDWEE